MFKVYIVYAAYQFTITVKEEKICSIFCYIADFFGVAKEVGTMQFAGIDNLCEFGGGGKVIC